MNGKKQVIELRQQINGLIQAFTTFQREQARTDQETRDNINKLAAVNGLVFSNDVNDWISKQKLEALKKEPR